MFFESLPYPASPVADVRTSGAQLVPVGGFADSGRRPCTVVEMTPRRILSTFLFATAAACAAPSMAHAHDEPFPVAPEPAVETTIPVVVAESDGANSVGAGVIVGGTLSVLLISGAAVLISRRK
jgi:hypothetical protein